MASLVLSMPAAINGSMTSIVTRFNHSIRRYEVEIIPAEVVLVVRGFARNTFQMQLEIRVKMTS